jgi:hypothetical protein
LILAWGILSDTVSTRERVWGADWGWWNSFGTVKASGTPLFWDGWTLSGRLVPFLGVWKGDEVGNMAAFGSGESVAQGWVFKALIVVV